MSLIKQLWLTILVLLLIAFGGSLFIAITTTKQALEQEVSIKNADNANALALSMSQLSKDPTEMELLIAAQFDTGHYRRIELRDTDGDIMEAREADETIDEVPGWFVDLTRFSIPAGEAVIQDGWQQYATIEVETQHSYAYRSLWRSTLQLLGWFGLAAIVSGLLAWWIVHTIRRPLQAVIDQAREIGRRRFTTSRLPKTRELRDVVEAMNQLSASVSSMLSQEGDKLEQLRRRLQHDSITGAVNRDHFMRLLDTALKREDDNTMGCIAIIRVAQLAELNEQLGRSATDKLLAELTRELQQIARSVDNGQVGRLNGSDFALLLPGEDDLEALSARLTDKLHAHLDGQPLRIALPMAIRIYHQHETRAQVLSALDGELARAESQGDRAVILDRGEGEAVLFQTHDEWRAALVQAIHDGVSLARYPVLDNQGGLLHYEAPSRLRLCDKWQPAGVFMPWISRLGMNSDMDLAVVDTALRTVAENTTPVALNISPRAANDPAFISALKARLQAAPEAAPHLWFEVPEIMAVHHLESFRSLCRELERFGCRMGLEHVGPEFSKIAQLHDVGLSYLKIDASLVNNVDDSVDQQSILRGMATLCHSIGIKIIAEGVETDAEHTTLLELGFDGMTGPGIRLSD
ncbi:EAL domain-containing protein [Aidingimonas halophila]|uniref:Diguanylate cyclase/phosphodiesterase n=1 Tax=Aidingimonas halophila TaxID=574349 RepID=A0A1H3ASI2_9GAMM|nr:EAL domain-containing protein [Aidingimonas halophila]GHC25179.1 GGDEF domain-containing protein [Aidingimonas halophila]SDX32084.1 diguanylate cyclase/phosphodiesterase [Aidingimonas halophila]